MKGKELFLSKHPFSKLSQDVNLYLRTPIISIKYKKSFNIVNSEQFIITDIDKINGFIYAENDYKKDIKIPINKFQQMFHVAYCITSHKSQGQTIEHVLLVLEDDSAFKNKNTHIQMIYTGITRASKKLILCRKVL